MGAPFKPEIQPIVAEESTPQPAAPASIDCRPSSTVQKYPHETDCDKYYWCVHEKPLLQSCKMGTVFESTTGRCDWPSNNSRSICVSENRYYRRKRSNRRSQ